ncbi:MAG: site-specific DNA-methyltransferase [Rhabdochlamydiaceae bacterium]
MILQVWNMKNFLYQGNSLSIMRTISDNNVDLIYLDPPFFTNRAHEAHTQTHDSVSFDDIWKNGIDEYLEFMKSIFRESLRILNKNGTLFLHCDWHAVHYLKVELDKIFGYHNFRNEIIWTRHNSQNNHKQGAKIFGRMHDSILFYSKSSDYIWNQPYEKYSEDYIKRTYRNTDEDTGERYALGDLSGPGGASKGNPYFEFMGFTQHWRYNKEKMNELLKQGKIVQTRPGTLPKLKRYLKDMKGVSLSDVWTNIQSDQTKKRHSVMYPTQKSLELLDRIIVCATNKGDLVLDPFCGSGSTLIAAQNVNRNWIGIDVSPQAIEITKLRLKKFGISEFQMIKNSSQVVKQYTT